MRFTLVVAIASLSVVSSIKTCRRNRFPCSESSWRSSESVCASNKETRDFSLDSSHSEEKRSDSDDLDTYKKIAPVMSLEAESDYLENYKQEVLKVKGLARCGKDLNLMPRNVKTDFKGLDCLEEVENPKSFIVDVKHNFCSLSLDDEKQASTDSEENLYQFIPGRYLGFNPGLKKNVMKGDKYTLERLFPTIKGSLKTN